MEVTFISTLQDKTRQDKTRKVKTRQDKTRQVKTSQDKDKTRQDKDKTRRDNFLAAAPCCVVTTLQSGAFPAQSASALSIRFLHICLFAASVLGLRRI
jgi:hypothetical protein